MSSSTAQARAIARNRMKKVADMGEWIWERLTPEERADVTLVDRVSALSQEQRVELSRRAGCKSVPSEDTWAALCTWVSTQVKIERSRQGYYGRPLGRSA